MNLMRLRSDVGLSALVAALWATACGSGGSGNAVTTPPDTSSNANLPGSGAGSAAMGANGTATGASGANAETGAGNVPLSGAPGSGSNMSAAASAPVNPVTSGSVPCGAAGTFCQQPSPTCCTVRAAGAGMGMGAGANTFSCAADAASCPAGTVTVATCSSSVSCGNSEVCCRTPNPPPAAAMGGGNNGTSAACAAACATGDTQLCLGDAECGAGNLCNLGNNGTGTCGPAPCTATSCATGEICCRGNGGGGGGGVAACVAPTGGLCPNGRQQVCDTAADCPADSGDTCVAAGGGAGGGVLVCTAPPCTPGSCTGAGQLCCVGGGGGNATCQASVAPVAPATNATCPNNARQFCALDADCTAIPGTVCLAGGNGGQLSCRPPVCTPGSCAAGDLCCVGQGGGALPTCVTPAAPAAGAVAACPGSNANNSRLVCATDADCASVLTAVPGATCNVGPNAAATLLTCRVPPPPVVVGADAGAGG
jgi:hypothetical protein